MNVEELRLKLPPLPPTIVQPGIEVTEQTFIVWDLTGDTIKAIAFLRDDPGMLPVK